MEASQERLGACQTQTRTHSIHAPHRTARTHAKQTKMAAFHRFLGLFEFASLEDLQPGQWISFAKVRLLPEAAAAAAQLPAPYGPETLWDLACLRYAAQPRAILELYQGGRKVAELAVGGVALSAAVPASG
jgi:hypothetical protein